MKKKNIFKISTAALSLLFVSFGTAGCGHEHVIHLEELVPATCTEEGVAMPKCNLCGQIFDYVSIPVDPDAHDWSEWEITQPTESDTGLAVKTCAYNSEHTIEEVLPSLSQAGTDYAKVDKISEPSAFSEGETEYTYICESGFITFIIKSEPTGIVTVSDAVEAAVRFKGQIREANGEVGSLAAYSPSTFKVEFGDQYAHIVDNADYIERWYSVEEGQFYGYTYSEGEGYYSDDGSFHPQLRVDTSSSSLNYLEGFRFQIGHGGSAFPDYYGAENIINGFYNNSVRNFNGDFHEEVVNDPDGTVWYTFGYTQLNGNDKYNVINIKFRLTDTFAVKEMIYDGLAYTQGQFTYDRETETGHLNAGIGPGSTPYRPYIHFVQTLISELSEEEQNNPPTNPYGKDASSIKGFRVRIGTSVLNDETPVQVSATQENSSGTVQTINFNIDRIEPELADLTTDPIAHVYWIVSGSEVEITLNTLSTYGFLVNIDNTNHAIRMQARRAGVHTFVIQTQNGYRKTVLLEVLPIAPQRGLNAYIYDRNTNAWTKSSSVTVKPGQTLYLDARVDPAEANYADATYTPSVLQPNATVTMTQFDKKDVVKFVAMRAGNYTVELTSKSSSSVKATIAVTVSPAPDAVDLFSGSYVAKTPDLTAGAGRDRVIELTFTPNADAATGKATITMPSGLQATYTYEYVPNATNPSIVGTLNMTYSSGAIFEVHIYLDDSFALAVEYETEFTDGNTGERLSSTAMFSPVND